MIADDVRLDLVSKTRLNGKAEVSRYFGNYSGSTMASGARLVEDGRPSWCSIQRPGLGAKYFMLLQWSAGRSPISAIPHASYVIDGAEYLI